LISKLFENLILTDHAYILVMRTKTNVYFSFLTKAYCW